MALGALFLSSWVIQTWAGWEQFVSEAYRHGDPASLAGYLPAWAEATFENWQSEFLQLLTFIVLTKFLIFRGSHESRDGDDEMRAQLDRIERRLGQLGR